MGQYVVTYVDIIDTEREEDIEDLVHESICSMNGGMWSYYRMPLLDEVKL